MNPTSFLHGYCVRVSCVTKPYKYRVRRLGFVHTQGKIQAKAMSQTNELYALTLRTFPEIGDTSFSCVLFSYKHFVLWGRDTEGCIEEIFSRSVSLSLIVL